jgi:hypothetical protein
MAEILSRQIKMGIPRTISIVNKRWEDVDIERDLLLPYHLTIASFSLGMLDLRESIQKMIAATTGTIVIYWHAGLQSWDEDSMELFPRLHSKRYYPVPESDIVFNVLYSMGIYPDVAVLRRNWKTVYPSFEELFDSYALRYNAVTEDQKKLLAAYLKEIYLPFERDSMIRFTRTVSMRLSWETQICTKTVVT